MNKLGKKIITFAAATIMAASTAFTASADYYFSGSSLGHKNDEWEYGNVWGLTGNYQYSNFYCNNKTHTATAVIVYGSNTRDQVKKEAKKGKWAKAKTKRHSSMKQWNSYYNHP